MPRAIFKISSTRPNSKKNKKKQLENMCMPQLSKINVRKLLWYKVHFCGWICDRASSWAPKKFELRIHDTLVLKTTANLTFVLFLCCHLINTQDSAKSERMSRSLLFLEVKVSCILKGVFIIECPQTGRRYQVHYLPASLKLHGW